MAPTGDGDPPDFVAAGSIEAGTPLPLSLSLYLSFYLSLYISLSLSIYIYIYDL